MSSTKAKGLYDLYREEKKHEERTKRMLQELERNNEELQMAKMKVVEKLLDIQVKDELSRQKNLGASSALDASSHRGTESIREIAKRRLHDEVKANVSESRNLFADGFLSHMDRLVRTSDDEARGEVSKVVDNYVDPHIEMLRRAKRSQPQTALQSVIAAASQVAVQKRRELDEQAQYRIQKDAADRMARVDTAEKLFHRSIGDLSILLHCRPVPFVTDIGIREAELNDLRSKILKQKAEEERLLQERQIQRSLIDADQAKLVADVESTCQKLILMQRELETKELDVKEMSASQQPGSGAWATNTMQLERDLSLAVEEEFHLRHEADEVRKTSDVLATERAALDAEIAESIAGLDAAQSEYQSILSKIESKLASEKQKIYAIRESETEATRKINELRYRMLYRREDIRRQKRDLRSVINTTISQLSIEDRMQSALMARSTELQKAAEKARSQADHHIASLNNQLVAINTDLKSKSNNISSLAEQLTNYFAGAERIKEVKSTAVQLQTQIDNLVKEWYRVEWDAASNVAQIASRVDLCTREKERALRAMGSFAVLQEDLNSEGIDIEATLTEELSRVREQMYNDATQRAYREAKYTQCIRLFRERQSMKARGDKVEPLTKVRRVSLEDRRMRREAAERSRAARQIALEHLKRHNENSERSVQRSTISSGGSGSALGADAHSTEFRALVVNFIKKEIQPLYDSNQLTRKRFVDIVSRVSSWFLETHRPANELTEVNVKEIVRKIQETITWQDDERMRVRQ